MLSYFKQIITKNLALYQLQILPHYTLIEYKVLIELFPYQVDVIVTTAGGVEEDIIKCLGPTYLGDFSLSGRDLRKRGINRIGNLLVPNDNYCKFETWLTPILNKMLEEQKNDVSSCSIFVVTAVIVFRVSFGLRQK